MEGEAQRECLIALERRARCTERRSCDEYFRISLTWPNYPHSKLPTNVHCKSVIKPFNDDTCGSDSARDAAAEMPIFCVLGASAQLRRFFSTTKTFNTVNECSLPSQPEQLLKTRRKTCQPCRVVVCYFAIYLLVHIDKRRLREKQNFHIIISRVAQTKEVAR